MLRLDTSGEKKNKVRTEGIYELVFCSQMKRGIYHDVEKRSEADEVNWEREFLKEV